MWVQLRFFILGIILTSLLANVCAQHVAQPKHELAKGHYIHWFLRGSACTVRCVTGDCDKGEMCERYTDVKRKISEVKPESLFVVKGRKVYFKQEAKKYLLGDHSLPKSRNLFDDKNERIVFGIIPRPAVLSGSTTTEKRTIKEIRSKPFTYKTISKQGDLYLGKLPVNQTDSFEMSIKMATYCSRQLCEVWSYYDVHRSLSQYINQTAYASLPILFDTLSAPSPPAFSWQKKISIVLNQSETQQPLSAQSIKELIQSINEPAYTIKNVEVKLLPTILVDSVSGANQQIQVAQSIIAGIKALPFGKDAQSTITVGDSWREFKKEVVLTTWYALADSSKPRAVNTILLNQILLNDMQSFLNQVFVTEIVLEIAFDPITHTEDSYWHKRMIRAVKEKNYTDALMFQKALMQLYAKGKITYDKLVSEDIPLNPYTVTLLNNQCAFYPTADERKTRYGQLYELDKNNPLTKYNLLVVQLNALQGLSAEDVEYEMHKHLWLYNTINSASIPLLYYQILKARFYPILTENKKEKKLETYDMIKHLTDPLPYTEVLIIADKYASNERYDIASRLLMEHHAKVPPSDATYQKYFVLRMIYYGKASEHEYSEKMYEQLLSNLHQTDGAFFKQLFDEHKFSYKLLENKHIIKIYQQSANH